MHARATEELFEAVYANPSDDAPRLVLADHLQELGDPRGEFISLQCSAQQTEKNKKRQAALLRKHWRAWLGEIEPAIRGKSAPEFRRGFLVSATVMRMSDAVAASPAWATLEELWFYGDALRPSMRHVRALHAPPLDRLLDPEGPTWLVEELELDVNDLEVCKALERTDRLPQLRRLHVAGRADWLLRSKLAAKLESLRIKPQGASGRGAGAPRFPQWFAEAIKLPALEELILDLTFLGESCAWIHRGTLTLERPFTKAVFVPGDSPLDPRAFESGFKTLVRDVPMRELEIVAEVDRKVQDTILAITKAGGVERLVVNGQTHELPAQPRAPAPKPSPLKDATKLAFDPDGNVCVAANTSVVVNGAEWPCEWRVDAIAASARHVAAGFSCYVRIFDRKTGESVHRLRATSGQVSALAFSPDGKTLAAGASNNMLTLIDPFTGKMQAPQKLHKSPIWSVRFSPDGKQVATTSSDNTIRIVDVAKRRTLRQITAHTNVVTDVVLTADATYSSSHDGTVRRFDLQGEQKSIHTRTKKKEDEFVGAWRLALTPSALAVAWYEGELTLHDREDLRLLKRAQIAKRLRDVACSPDGTKLAVVHESGVSFVDAQTLRLLDMSRHSGSRNEP